MNLGSSGATGTFSSSGADRFNNPLVTSRTLCGTTGSDTPQTNYTDMGGGLAASWELPRIFSRPLGMEVVPTMTVELSSEPVEVLRYVHAKLDSHFRILSEARKQLEPASPVFALEHDLGATDYDLLLSGVRNAVSQGFSARHRLSWLPFVVYAAESGYDYVGDEYWPSFEESTPGWHSDQRRWIKDRFLKFADEYGGAVPTGAFAKNFTIIAWPIAHAVLPTYLQRQLAQLLYEFRTGLSSSLLDDPVELGIRLAVRSQGYTERFRIFCQNTALLGQVAAALLSGEDESSPYLVSSTLKRLVDGLSRERQSRLWLASAQQAASRVRASGFKKATDSKREGYQTKRERLPAPTDPRFFLRYLDGVWNAYAELPDLIPLSERLPEAYDELRTMRARVTGARRPVPTGALIFGGQEVRFDMWPDPSKPFVQLEHGTDPVNSLIEDQCVMTRGPWWLYRCEGAGLAIEVKRQIVRAGHRYILVGLETQAAPNVSWCRQVPIRASGVSAYEIDMPNRLTDADTALLVTHGISTLSGLAVRPVGIVASAWDGEGAVEWLPGEPAIVGIRADSLPSHCLLMVDNDSHFVQWPGGESELIISLEGLDVGTHDVTATFHRNFGQELAKGSLAITIRDPQVRPEGATRGEGMRLLASPARPTLAELWDERATVVVDGPPGAAADLTVSLLGGEGSELVKIRRTVRLPLTEKAWTACTKSIRNDKLFKDSYDEAESCVLTVSRWGVGAVSLSCERGFQPFRWRFGKERDGSVVATLHDRTDGGRATVEFFAVDAPLDAISNTFGVDVVLPPRGGLLRATSDESEVLVIAPTNPNAVFALGKLQPYVPCYGKSPNDIRRFIHAHRRWATAQLPADPFAVYQQHVALEAIARANVMSICGAHWAQVERSVERADELVDHLDEMQSAVGVSAAHRFLAAEIGRNLYLWLTPQTLEAGFAEVMKSTFRRNGIKTPSAARFVLTLAGRPGDVTEWNACDLDYLLEWVVASPVLLRAARFAVLGTRSINTETAGRGF